MDVQRKPDVGRTKNRNVDGVAGNKSGIERALQDDGAELKEPKDQRSIVNETGFHGIKSDRLYLRGQQAIHPDLKEVAVLSKELGSGPINGRNGQRVGLALCNVNKLTQASPLNEGEVALSELRLSVRRRGCALTIRGCLEVFVRCLRFEAASLFFSGVVIIALLRVACSFLPGATKVKLIQISIVNEACEVLPICTSIGSSGTPSGLRPKAVIGRLNG